MPAMVQRSCTLPAAPVSLRVVPRSAFDTGGCQWVRTGARPRAGGRLLLPGAHHPATHGNRLYRVLCSEYPAAIPVGVAVREILRQYPALRNQGDGRSARKRLPPSRWCRMLAANEQFSRIPVRRHDAHELRLDADDRFSGIDARNLDIVLDRGHEHAIGRGGEIRTGPIQRDHEARRRRGRNDRCFSRIRFQFCRAAH